MQELIQVRSQFPAPMTVHYSRQRTITQPITGEFFLVAVFLSSSIASPSLWSTTGSFENVLTEIGSSFHQTHRSTHFQCQGT